MTTPLAKQVAEAAYFAAAEFLSCVEILHAGNVQAVTKEIEKRNCGMAFDLVKKAMFARVLFGVMIPFDPVRKGDYHLRAGIDLLRNKAAGVIGDQEKADEALSRFDVLEKDPSFERLRQIRNKEGSHLSKLDDKIERAIIGELLTFANSCGTMIEAFVAGCGLHMPSLASQVQPYTASATAFFSAFDAKSADG
jgi:hypothetical protein